MVDVAITNVFHAVIAIENILDDHADNHFLYDPADVTGLDLEHQPVADQVDEAMERVADLDVAVEKSLLILFRRFLVLAHTVVFVRRCSKRRRKIMDGTARLALAAAGWSDITGH